MFNNLHNFLFFRHFYLLYRFPYDILSVSYTHLAGTACALQDTSACRDDICQSAVLRQHVEYLLGAGADGQRNLRAYGLALEAVSYTQLDVYKRQLFHSPPGVLFTFPSRYCSTIGH